MNIPNEAIEAAAHGLAVQAWGEWEYVPDELRRLFLRDARIALKAAAPHLVAPVLALCDEADTRRGSSMYCKLTTYEVRKTIGVEE